MSDKADSPSGELEERTRESSLGQKEIITDEEPLKSAFSSSAEIVEMVDSLFPDTEHVSLESILAAKSKLHRQRQVLVQSASKLREEADEFAKQQENALKTARKLADQVAIATRDRPTLDDDDFQKVSDALQSTSSDSRRAIYFITLWLMKRLDQKLEKMFASTKSSTPLNSSQNSSSLVVWDDRVALVTYLELLDVASSIQSSACKNLVVAVTGAVEYWFKQLLDRFSRDLASKLEAIRYPFSTGMQPVPKELTKSPLPAELEGLITSARLLLELRPPPNWKSQIDFEVTATFASELAVKGSEEERFGQNLISELIAPMSRRFRFHFYGKRPTNSPEHPEWYHTQILSWLESNGQFVRALFEDACNTKDKQSVDSLYNSWTSVVVRLAVEKLSLDLPALLDSDAIFAHLIDETLLFRQSLFSFLAKQNATKVDIDPFRLLVSPGVFDRWLDVERKFALTRIDAFLSKSDALTISEKVINDAPNSKDIALAPTCVVDFVSLVSGLLDRCDVIMIASSIMQIQKQTAKQQTSPPFCQFLAMVLSLVDGFRIRLLQLGRSSDALSSRGLALLAAAGHLEDALAVDWIHRPVVVASQAVSPSLVAITSTPRNTGDEIVSTSPGSAQASLSVSSVLDFTDEASLFSRAVRELADDVVAALEMELAKACVSAAEDHARGEQSVDLPEEQASHLVITVAHCAAIALHNLLDRLRLGLGGSSALRRLVGSRLITRVDAVLFAQIFERLSVRRTVLAQVIAKELDEFIRTRVVYLLARHLSPTTQPIPSRLLPRVIDSLHLLTSVPEGSARLLRSTLTATDGPSQDEVASSLEELGCRTFAKSQDGAKLALLVLNIRFGAAF